VHICFITSVFSNQQGGIGGYVYNLGIRLIKSGHHVSVITRKDKHNEPHKEYIKGMRIYFAPILNIYPFHIFINTFFTQRIINSIEKSIDIIHFHTPLPPPIKHNKRNIVTFHTPMLVDTMFYERENIYTKMNKMMARYVSYPIEKRIINRASTLTAVANSVRNELMKVYKVNSLIHVLENGVDAKKYFPISYRKNIEKYILFVGRLTYRKGVYDLIESFSRLSKTDSLKLYIVGDGPIKKDLETLVRRMGLIGSVEFKGVVIGEKLLKLYQNAELFVVPSYYEGLPTVLLEAMACGIPVIATQISGNTDVIANNRNGLLIPSGNPEIMANTIQKVLLDDSLRSKLGLEARATILKRFDWDIIYSKFLSLYNDIRSKDISSKLLSRSSSVY